jgi:hypothetical protein
MDICVIKLLLFMCHLVFNLLFSVMSSFLWSRCGKCPLFLRWIYGNPCLLGHPVRSSVAKYILHWVKWALFSNRISRSSGWRSCFLCERSPPALAEVFHAQFYSLQEDTAEGPQVSSRKIPCCFQFVIGLSSYRLTLCNLAYEEEPLNKVRIWLNG